MVVGCWDFVVELLMSEDYIWMAYLVEWYGDFLFGMTDVVVVVVVEWLECVEVATLDWCDFFVVGF